MAIVKQYLGATCSLFFGFGLGLSRIYMFLVCLNCSGMVDHILPESPFAFPTKTSTDTDTIAQNGNIDNNSPHHVASSLFPPTSNLELPPYRSCFFQVPR